jgi:hypothetical protein
VYVCFFKFNVYVILSRARPNLTNKFSNLYSHYSFIEFRHNLYISHVLPDDGLSGPKHVVSGVIKNLFVCVTVTPPFLAIICSCTVMETFAKYFTHCSYVFPKAPVLKLTDLSELCVDTTLY